MSRVIFKLNFVPKSYAFCKIKIVTSHRGGPSQCHQMTHGGGRGGSKIVQKSVTYYLNGPLRQEKRERRNGMPDLKKNCLFLT